MATKIFDINLSSKTNNRLDKLEEISQNVKDIPNNVKDLEEQIKNLQEQLDKKADKSEYPDLSLYLKTADFNLIMKNYWEIYQIKQEISRLIYKEIKIETVNAKEYILEDFDNSKWYKFNLEYKGSDNNDYSGTLERPAGITMLIKDCNVGNDFSASSSATLTFDATQRKVQVLNWGKNPFVITKVTLYSKDQNI